MGRGSWGNNGVLKEVYRHAMDSKQEEMNPIVNQYFRLIKTYNITDPNKDIQNYDKLIETILTAYGIKNHPASAQYMQNELINCYETGKEDLFKAWVPK